MKTEDAYRWLEERISISWEPVRSEVLAVVREAFEQSVESEDEDEPKEACPDCGGSGKRSIPLYGDQDEIEGWTERKCSFCGGEGYFDPIQAAELKAEMGQAWYDG